MPIHLTCSTCGKAVFRKPSHVKERNFCSVACRYAPPRPILSSDGITALVPLCASNGSIRAYVTIDAEDAEWAAQWRWCSDSYNYAMRRELIDGRKQTIKMHRELLGLMYGDGMEGDHIDRDTLNCRRSNLRPGTKAMNRQNLPSYTGSTSQYRGVCWDSRRGQWRAEIQIGGKKTSLGRFDSEDEAAEAARAARLRLMPFAVD